MKKIVISLKRRKDRKKLFKNNNLKDYKYLEAIDYKTLDSKDIIIDEEFRDTFKNRQVLKIEEDCFLSYRQSW